LQCMTRLAVDVMTASIHLTM